ncbi:MAG: phosphoadenylyl-sulfate reductase [Candidatus Omnitrophica bacterium]|nr:phosphoadenylyl-sulfate reductase [Candidatus Omnitrophota bacterium]
MTRELDIEKLNRELEAMKSPEIVAWALKEFSPKITMTSSFGPESGVLLHMVSRVDPATPILFLETGYHFPETIEYKKQLTAFLGLTNIVDLRADEADRQQLIEKTGGTPYEVDPDRCCQLNKVEPLDAALGDYEAWMSGIRRHQTDFRKSVRILELYEGGRYKISPLANFTSRDAWWYLKEHKIPQHPLFEKGYLSIGCWPCTRPIQAGDDERSGRWAGKSKKECGIHTFKEIKSKDKEPEDKTGLDDLSANI